MLPEAKDINVYDSLDERVACKNFLGKTLAEAEAMFRDSWDYYHEDLMWMGPRAFRYYVTAAIRYLHSDSSARAQASYFTGILDSKLPDERHEIKAIATELVETCRYIFENAPKFSEGQSFKLEYELRTSCLRLIDQLQELAREE